MQSFLKRIVTLLIQWEARLVLKKYKPRIIAVVGSVGKTSAKDAIFTALSDSFYIRKSEKSFNSDIGIPLTILGVGNAWSNPFLWVHNLFEGLVLILVPHKYPEWIVLEVGIDRPGDMRKLTAWLTPDIVVLTRLPDVPVHVEYFDSPEAVIKEKLLILSALKEGGTLVLNADDERIRAVVTEHPKLRAVTFGMEKENEVHASHYMLGYHEHKPKGVRFRVNHHESSVSVEVDGVLGKQHVYPVLAAFAVADILGEGITDVGRALAETVPPPGRMRMLPGIKETTLIDDSYNSSPVAALEALETLDHVKGQGRKIAVLGDMLELGSYTGEQHKNLGKRAGAFCDLLVTVGQRARNIAEGALRAGLSEKKILQYDDAQRAGKELETLIEHGDIILIKGSQSVRMERTVEELMLEPLRKGELLVRQDEAWQKR